MKLNMDTIVFEDRWEINNIRKALFQFLKEHPTADESKYVKELADKLDVMDMNW